MSVGSVIHKRYIVDARTTTAPMPHADPERLERERKAYFIFLAVLPFASSGEIFKYGAVSHAFRHVATNERIYKYLLSRDFPCQFNPSLNHIDDTYYASYRKLVRIFYNFSKNGCVVTKIGIKLKPDMELRYFCPFSSRIFFVTTSHKVKIISQGIGRELEIDISKGGIEETQITVVQPIDRGNKVLINSVSLRTLFLYDVLSGAKIYEFADFHPSERVNEIDPTSFASITAEGRIRFWNVISGEMTREYVLDAESFFEKISPVRDRVIFLRERRDRMICTSKLIRTIALLENNLQQFREFHRKPVHTLMISDEMVFSASEDQMTIAIVEFNRLLDDFIFKFSDLTPPPNRASAYHITPNNRLCIGHGDGTINIWDCNKNYLQDKDTPLSSIRIKPFSDHQDSRIVSISHTFDHIIFASTLKSTTCINVVNGEILWPQTYIAVRRPIGYNGNFFISAYPGGELTLVDYTMTEEDQLLDMLGKVTMGGIRNFLDHVGDKTYKPRIAHSLFSIWRLTASEFLKLDRDVLLQLEHRLSMPPNGKIGISIAIYHVQLIRIAKDLKSKIPRLLSSISKRWEKLPEKLRKQISPPEGRWPDLRSEQDSKIKICVEHLELFIKNWGFRKEEEKKEASFPVAIQCSLDSAASSSTPHTRPDPFNLLPTVLLDSIFSFLPGRDVFRYGYISKNWRLLSSKEDTMKFFFRRDFGNSSIPFESDTKECALTELSWREKFRRAHHYYYHLRSIPLEYGKYIKFSSAEIFKYDPSSKFAIIKDGVGPPSSNLLCYNLHDKTVVQALYLERIQNFKPILITGELHLLLLLESDSTQIVVMKNDKSIIGFLRHPINVVHFILGPNETIITQDIANTIRVWDLKTCTHLQEIISPVLARQRCFKIDRSATSVLNLFMGTDTGEIHCLNLENEFAAFYTNGTKPIKAIKVLKNGLLVVESEDIDIPALILIPPSLAHKGWKCYRLNVGPLKPSSIKITNQNHVILTCGGEIKVWKITFDPKLHCLIDLYKRPISPEEPLLPTRTHRGSETGPIKIIKCNGNHVFFDDASAYKIWNCETGELFVPKLQTPGNLPSKSFRMKIDARFQVFMDCSWPQISISFIDAKNHDNLLLSLAYHFERNKFHRLPAATKNTILHIKSLITPTTPEFMESYLLDLILNLNEIPEQTVPFMKLAIFKYTLESIAESILRAPKELSEEMRNRFLYLERDYYKILFPKILKAPIPTDPKTLYQEGRKAFYMLSAEACAGLIRSFVEEEAKTYLNDPKNSFLYESGS